MHRIGRLWEQVVTMDNLFTAFCKARKGKRRRPDVARFSLDLEQALCTLQRELASGEYMPGTYRQFTVYERKPRVISVAPFRDRAEFRGHNTYFGVATNKYFTKFRGHNT